MTGTPPDEPEGTRFLAILTVRNEGAFLIDWFAHHRATGFTDFLVFSNDCQDGTDRMLDRLQDMGWLTHIRNDNAGKRGPQWSALNLASRHPVTQRAAWILFFDIDEYVNIHAGDRTLTALLSALPDATAIPLTWRLFGNDGIRSFEDNPVTEQFTRAAPKVMGWPWRAALFKTLFRNDGTYAKIGVHRPLQPDPARLAAQRWFDGSGRELPASMHTQRIFSDYGRDNYRLVQLNHYALGAMESYVLKCDRGRANRDESAFDMSYWVERNLSAEVDKTIAAMACKSRPIRDALRADAQLGALHAAAVDWRRQRFSALMAEESYRGLFGRLMMTPPSRVLTAEEHRILTGYAKPRKAKDERETEKPGPGALRGGRKQ
ncbi:MAG: glycosyltransferase family 2 protein [Rhodobacteraceae bacterium]|nr:glycosyltransferase family 2 protein [Paracoccaceae bacterium]